MPAVLLTWSPPTLGCSCAGAWREQLLYPLMAQTRKVQGRMKWG